VAAVSLAVNLVHVAGIGGGFTACSGAEISPRKLCEE
jgi:hypothetical protein